jgi:hypothetical protein
MIERRGPGQGGFGQEREAAGGRFAVRERGAARWIAVALACGSLAMAPTLGAQTLGGCPLFPSDNVWNVPVDELPVHPMSTTWIAAMGAETTLHPDFGANWNGGPFGIPYDLVPQNASRVPVELGYWDESAREGGCSLPSQEWGCYPIPANPSIEGGPSSTGDRHILMLEQGNCWLWETWYTWPPMSLPDEENNPGWYAGSGARFDLRSNALWPDTWTSADAAGLPILPGLVRLDEADQGSIHHAFRFTTQPTHHSYLWPARHRAGISDTSYPPMGIRVRLRKTFPIAGYSPRIQAILRAMKKYGMMLADNGSDWYVSGVPSAGWDDDELVDAFDDLQGRDFEVVDQSSLIIDPDSGQTPSAFRDGFELGSLEGWDRSQS